MKETTPAFVLKAPKNIKTGLLLAGLIALVLTAWLAQPDITSIATSNMLLYAIALAGFGVCFVAFNMLEFRNNIRTNQVLLLCQALLTLAAFTVTDKQLLYILVIITAGQLAWAFSRWQAITFLVLLNLVIWFIMINTWQQPLQEIAQQSIMFLPFQLFAWSATSSTISEENARRTLEIKNAELAAAQAMLSQTIANGERLKLSRDLHDIVGHQLTALILNLEFASQTTEGNAKQHIDDAKSLSKSLLTDIRDVVRQHREQNAIDLTQVIQQMLAALPSFEAQLTIDDTVHQASQNTLFTLLRITQEAITNVVKHASHLQMQISITNQEDGLTAIFVSPTNTHTQLNKRVGSGLKGMQERAEQIGGSLHINIKQQQFIVQVQLPLHDQQSSTESTSTTMADNVFTRQSH